MATNYTEKLELAQWEPEDEVRRSEFNENNLKLEEYLGHMRRYLIMETTTQLEAASVSLSLEGLNWGDYDYVYIDHDLYAFSGYIMVRVNGSTYSQQCSTFSVSYSNSSGYIASFESGNETLKRMEFTVLKDANRRVNTKTYNGYINQIGFSTDVTYPNLNSLLFDTLASAKTTIPAGRKIRIWGVK